MTNEHIVTATEPAWAEQQHRPGDDGKPEIVPDTLELHPLDAMGYEATYYCTCGTELHSWEEVREHFKEVADNRGSSSRRRSPNEREIPSNQATLSDI